MASKIPPWPAKVKPVCVKLLTYKNNPSQSPPIMFLSPEMPTAPFNSLVFTKTNRSCNITSNKSFMMCLKDACSKRSVMVQMCWELSFYNQWKWLILHRHTHTLSKMSRHFLQAPGNFTTDLSATWVHCHRVDTTGTTAVLFIYLAHTAKTL